MGNRLPWTPWYWDDWDTDTAHLSLTEQGAYMALLKHYYRTGKSLPANADQLHRICRAHGEHEEGSVDSVAAQFFTRGPDGEYHNKRADLEIAKSKELSEKRAAAARSKSTANADQLPTQTHRHIHTPKPKEGGRPSPGRQADFDDRDMRKFLRARTVINQKLSTGWGQNLTDEQLFVEQCLIAEVPPIKMREVLARQEGIQ